MPSVVGKHLDVALSDVQRAGVNQEVDVVGGGVFGIVDKSNWTVCEQDPAPGAAVSAAPRVTVERACAGGSSRPSSGGTPKSGTTSAPTDQDTSSETSMDTLDPTAKFGQMLPFEAYQSGSGGGTVNLQITVSRPKPFKPKDPAAATQAANVYFTVTMKNTGTRDFEPGGSDEAISGLDPSDPGLSEMGGRGTDGDWIVPDDDGFLSGPGTHLAAGASTTYRVGFSVANADDVTFKLRPYGLGGNTLYWTR